MTSDETDPMDTDFETLSAYVDGELSGEETAGVEARLAVSPSDRATVDELRMLKAMLAAPPRPELSEMQAARLLRTVRRQLGLEDVCGKREAGSGKREAGSGKREAIF